MIPQHPSFGELEPITKINADSYNSSRPDRLIGPLIETGKFIMFIISKNQDQTNYYLGDIALIAEKQPNPRQTIARGIILIPSLSPNPATGEHNVVSTCLPMHLEIDASGIALPRENCATAEKMSLTEGFFFPVLQIPDTLPGYFNK